MNRNLVLRRLCWKEYRQLWPLIVMLAAIALVLQTLVMMMNSWDRGETSIAFFFGLPSLFAAGVGALLVGQEKDNRTLFWMASLPVFKKDIIRVKFLAGFAGLLAVWLISFALLSFTNGITPTFHRGSVEDFDTWYSILYSLFLLTVGFATAWNFRSTFVGLLVLVGVALVYTLATNFLTPSRSSDSVTTIVLIASSALALGVGWVAALRALSPTAPARFSQRTIAGRSFFDRSIVDQRTIQTPWSALIWQFAAQNRGMLIGVTLLFLIPLFILCASTKLAPGSQQQELAVPCFLIGFIAISWLGVIAFQGDNVNQRIRFLSDRGIAPRSIWLTRQIVPVGMVILAIITMALAAAVTLIVSRNGRLLSAIGPLVLVASGLLWIVYSVTQWMSQIIRSPIIASILAPVVGCLPLAYGAFALEVLEAPIWILAFVTCLPMFATYRMTRHWMDTRTGKRYWLEHLGWLALTVLLPAIPFFIVYTTYPSMPANDWAEFRVEGSRVFASNRSPIEISLLVAKDPTPQSDAEGGSTGDDAIDVGGMPGMGGSGKISGMGYAASEPNSLPNYRTLDEERELQMEFIERQLQSFDSLSPISSSYIVTKRLMGDAMLTRIRMEDDGNSDALLKRYQQDIRLVVRIIRGVRLMTDLKTQQIADQYEAWLVQEVRSPTAKEFMGSDVYIDAVAQLSDKAGRQRARFLALTKDWFIGILENRIDRSNGTGVYVKKTPLEHTLGGYSIPTNKNGTRLIARRHVSTVAWHMKQYLKASDSSAINQAKESVARDWNVSEAKFGLTATPFSPSQGYMEPWSFWYGEWERQADALKE